MPWDSLPGEISDSSASFLIGDTLVQPLLQKAAHQLLHDYRYKSSHQVTNLVGK